MIDQLIQTKRIFLVGGPGGVGKTTLAASLALQCAHQGHRTIVLTIDPARRLAQALGFKDGFNNDLQPVALGPEAKGTLSASMLDTTRYFDRVIERFATSETQKQKILSNPLYRAMVEGLGGTHEYAAMERLLEIANTSEFDRIIVDTPPSQNAMELFSAPERLADFMDNSVLKWFQSNKPWMSVLRTGTRLVMKLFQKLFGAEFMTQLSGFFDDLEGMQAGFRERNLEVIRWLRDDKTAFLLVNIPQQRRYRESLEFKSILDQRQIPLAAMIFNQIDPEAPPYSAETPPNVIKLIQFFETLIQNQQHWMTQWQETQPSIPILRIPKLASPPENLRDLMSLLG